MKSISPHGGKLIQRVFSKEKAEKIIQQKKDFQEIKLNSDLIMDVEKIALGAFSPLEGFMSSQDYNSVLHNMRLSNDTVWTIPITLNIEKEFSSTIKEGDEIILSDNNSNPIAICNIEEKYEQSKKEEAKNVYGTLDANHPGVNHTLNQPQNIIAGKITLIQRPESQFKEFELTPDETRTKFNDLKWNTIVAFHTRNPPHRAHEYLQKSALENVDGLFIHPVIGRKKRGDFSAEIILGSYRELIDKYYPKDKAILAALSTYSRYAGPREAIFTSLIRQNYGCTHMIIGGDHTGVGNYYPTYAAQEIFKKFNSDEIKITPLMFRRPRYCKVCSHVTTDKTCPHNESINEVSGTVIRDKLSNGEHPSNEIMRPEIASKIIEIAKITNWTPN